MSSARLLQLRAMQRRFDMSAEVHARCTAEKVYCRIRRKRGIDIFFDFWPLVILLKAQSQSRISSNVFRQLDVLDSEADLESGESYLGQQYTPKVQEGYFSTVLAPTEVRDCEETKKPALPASLC